MISMKATVAWIVGGILAVLIESSLFYAPVVLAWVWLAGRYLPAEKTIWLSLILGVILDILLVLPLGLSSLALLGSGLLFWYQRQLFADSLAAQILSLVLTLLLWSLWRGQSLVAASLVLLLALASFKLFAPRHFGVMLKGV